ncbi:MAG: ABC transporter permease, partial [Bacteroidia bacterium]|nr:ABC transporter permease [Bacteroidia bacterium]
MNKLLLIIGREIKSKITNKTFIIMTILAPVLITGFMAFVIKMSQAERTEQKVLVIDETHLFEGKLVGNDFVSITYSNEKYEKMLDKFSEEGYTCLLWVTPNFLEGGDGSVKIFFKKSPGFAFQTYIRGQMEKIIYEQKLKANNIDPTVITNARQKVKLVLEKIDDKGRSKEQSSFELFGFFSGAFMMIFILMYGMMVFRSVMEEKTNRIVEVIISSVKPFQL